MGLGGGRLCSSCCGDPYTCCKGMTSKCVKLTVQGVIAQCSTVLGCERYNKTYYLDGGIIRRLPPYYCTWDGWLCDDEMPAFFYSNEHGYGTASQLYRDPVFWCEGNMWWWPERPAQVRVGVNIYYMPGSVASVNARVGCVTFRREFDPAKQPLCEAINGMSLDVVNNWPDVSSDVDVAVCDLNNATAVIEFAGDNDDCGGRKCESLPEKCVSPCAGLTPSTAHVVVNGLADVGHSSDFHEINGNTYILDFTNQYFNAETFLQWELNLPGSNLGFTLRQSRPYSNYSPKMMWLRVSKSFPGDPYSYGWIMHFLGDPFPKKCHETFYSVGPYDCEHEPQRILSYDRTTTFGYPPGTVQIPDGALANIQFGNFKECIMVPDWLY